MKIGIIAAMPEELVYLLQHLEESKEEKVLDNSYHTGKIGTVACASRERDWESHVSYECRNLS